MHVELYRSNSCSMFYCPGTERLWSAHQAVGEVQEGANRSNKSECFYWFLCSVSDVWLIPANQSSQIPEKALEALFCFIAYTLICFCALKIKWLYKSYNITYIFLSYLHRQHRMLWATSSNLFMNARVKHLCFLSLLQMS